MRYAGVRERARCPDSTRRSSRPAREDCRPTAGRPAVRALWQNARLTPPSIDRRPRMSHSDVRSAIRPNPDKPMVDIADYVVDYRIDSQEAYDTARYMLLDSLACAMLAMKFDGCVKHLGPIVRWLDFNDTWLAAEWGHPSDNLGAILAVADWMNRKAVRDDGGRAITVRDVLGWAIKAHEIQGVYALQ